MSKKVVLTDEQFDMMKAVITSYVEFVNPFSDEDDQDHSDDQRLIRELADIFDADISEYDVEQVQRRQRGMISTIADIVETDKLTD